MYMPKLNERELISQLKIWEKIYRWYHPSLRIPAQGNVASGETI